MHIGLPYIIYGTMILNDVLRSVVHGPVPRQAPPDAEEPDAALRRDAPYAALLAGRLPAGQRRPHQDMGQSDARDLRPDVRLGRLLPQPGRGAAEAVPALLQAALAQTADL